MTRRRMMVTGLVAATMLVTLRARPALAGGGGSSNSQSGSLGLSYGVYGASSTSTGGSTGGTKKKKKH